jgi:hypothetical protein
MLFAARLSHLIRLASPGFDWAARLVFGSAAVWIGVTLVADGLEGGATLDTLGGNADPSAVRALIDGTLLIFNGSIAFVLTGLFLAAAGYATFATGVLPRWTGWIAYVAAALCAISVPAMFAGPLNYTGSTTRADGVRPSSPISLRSSGSWLWASLWSASANRRR